MEFVLPVIFLLFCPAFYAAKPHDERANVNVKHFWSGTVGEQCDESTKATLTQRQHMQAQA